MAVLSCGDDSVEPNNVAENTETIPFINIKTARSIGWDNKHACLAYYVENGDTTKLSARIKCRGGISSKYGKHSYSIEFERDLGLCGITPDDDWILNASYIDKTFQRHKLSYDLFRQMNPENVAAECGYIKVFINGKYDGLYVAMEEINASMIGLDKTDLGAVLFKDPPIFYEEPIGVFKDSNNFYQQKFPKIDDLDASLYVDAFNTLIFRAADHKFDNDIEDHVNLKNIIDWHLILLLTNNDDGLFKNFYLYKIGDGAKLSMAIWDYDHSFGRDGDGALNMMEREVGWEKIILLKRLVESDTLNYAQSLRERWQELRSNGVFTFENIEKMISENSKILKPNLKENSEKWPLNSKWYEDDNDYDQEIEIIKKFVKMRFEYLDEYLKNLE